jgi:hypothetical protein
MRWIDLCGKMIEKRFESAVAIRYSASPEIEGCLPLRGGGSEISGLVGGNEG